MAHIQKEEQTDPLCLRWTGGVSFYSAAYAITQEACMSPHDCG